jgi:hypothetical protein
MPLSPHEQKVLAGLAEGLRADDPALADALGRAPTAFPTLAFPLSIRSLLVLIATLTGLATLGTFFADRLGVLGMAVVTCAAIGPWLVGAARAATRRSGDVRPRRLPPWLATPLATGPAGMFAGVLLTLVVMSLLPPGWRAVIMLMIVFVVLPCIVLRIATQPKRPDNTG